MLTENLISTPSPTPGTTPLTVGVSDLATIGTFDSVVGATGPNSRMSLIGPDITPLQDRRTGGRLAELDFGNDVGIADEGETRRADSFVVDLLDPRIRTCWIGTDRSFGRRRRRSSMDGRWVPHAFEACSYRAWSSNGR